MLLITFNYNLAARLRCPSEVHSSSSTPSLGVARFQLCSSDFCAVSCYLSRLLKTPRNVVSFQSFWPSSSLIGRLTPTPYSLADCAATSHMPHNVTATVCFDLLFYVSFWQVLVALRP